MKNKYILSIANIDCECNGLNKCIAMRSTGLFKSETRFQQADYYQDYYGNDCWLYIVELNGLKQIARIKRKVENQVKEVEE